MELEYVVIHPFDGHTVGEVLGSADKDRIARNFVVARAASKQAISQPSPNMAAEVPKQAVTELATPAEANNGESK